MADFDTSFPSRFADLLAKYADSDGAKVSTQINVGGNATSVNLSMSTSGENGQTVLSTEVNAEIDGATISATSDAAGEDASTSVEVSADVQEDGAEVEATANAEAAGVSADTTTASTNVVVSPEFEILQYQQDTKEVPSDGGYTEESQTAFAGTLEGTLEEPLALEQVLTFEEVAPSFEEIIPIETEAADDWLL